MGLWPGLSATRISASIPLTLSVGTKAKLSGDGTPIVELMVWSSAAGTIARILVSACATNRSVCSIRVPDGARKWIFIMPASVDGKKSVPMMPGKKSVIPSTRAAAVSVYPRCTMRSSTNRPYVP